MARFSLDEVVSATNGKCIQIASKAGVKNVVIDSRQVRSGYAFVAIRGVNQDGHAYIQKASANGASVIIVSKSLKRYPKAVTVITVKDTTRALGQLASAHRQRFDIPVIAVTGSAGKTTVKDMIAAVLRTKYRVLKTQGTLNNQWGLPLTLLRLSGRYNCAVVEVGISQPGEMKNLADIVRPTLAVFTNIGMSHLQGLKTPQKVFEEKAYLAKVLLKDGCMVYCADDHFLKKLKAFHKNSITFGLSRRADIRAEKIISEKQGMSFKINGRHFIKLRAYTVGDVRNALAACACGKALGVRFSAMIDSLKRFRPASGRQNILKFGSIMVIDDSYNANPVSFVNALAGLVDFKNKGRKHIVCADMLELGARSLQYHRDLGKRIQDADVDYLWTHGKMAKAVVQAACSEKIQARHYDNIKDLNRNLFKALGPKDVVLVKGSRGMHMERVVEFLKLQLS